MYNIEDPLTMIKKPPPNKSTFSDCVKTKVTIFYEHQFRALAAKNSKMSLLNISLKGLNGHPHPVLQLSIRLKMH